MFILITYTSYPEITNYIKKNLKIPFFFTLEPSPNLNASCFCSFLTLLQKRTKSCLLLGSFFCLPKQERCFFKLLAHMKEAAFKKKIYCCVHEDLKKIKNYKLKTTYFSLIASLTDEVYSLEKGGLFLVPIQ